METDRLRYFCAIVECGSLTEAARLLGVSHSGLSKAMSLLQRELGARLFTPAGRGLAVTAQGRGIYERAKPLLGAVQALHAQGPRPLPETTRLAMPESLSIAVVGKLAAVIGAPVDLLELDAGEIDVQVLERKLDFGLTFVPYPRPDLEYLRLARVHLRSYARAGEFRGRDPNLIPYVVPAAELGDNPMSYRARDGWNEALARQAPYRAGQLSAALRIAGQGLAAIYIPDLVARAAPPALRLTPLDLAPARRRQELTERSVFLVKRRADPESRAMRRAARVVREACRASGASLERGD